MTIRFSVAALLASPDLAQKFNSEVERSYTDAAGLFAYFAPEGADRNDANTYNGLHVTLRGAKDETDGEGFWDADVTINAAEGFALVRGANGPSGGTGTFYAKVNAAGEVFETDHPYAKTGNGFEPIEIETDPRTGEAAAAIREAFAGAVLSD